MSGDAMIATKRLTVDVQANGLIRRASETIFGVQQRECLPPLQTGGGGENGPRDQIPDNGHSEKGTG